MDRVGLLYVDSVGIVLNEGFWESEKGGAICNAYNILKFPVFYLGVYIYP